RGAHSYRLEVVLVSGCCAHEEERALPNLPQPIPLGGRKLRQIAGELERDREGQRLEHRRGIVARLPLERASGELAPLLDQGVVHEPDSTVTDGSLALRGAPPCGAPDGRAACGLTDPAVRGDLILPPRHPGADRGVAAPRRRAACRPARAAPRSPGASFRRRPRPGGS